MKRLKHMLTFALLALLMAACSEDNALESSPTEGVEETVPVTFTARVDYSIGEPGGGAKASTRADEGETPTRFYAQAVTAAGELSAIAEGEANADGKYEFTLRLAPKTSYTYMFWADNATDDADPTDLRHVSYTAGRIAFAQKAEGTTEEVTKDITLKHVVAKVTLRTSTDATVSAGGSMGITTDCGTEYDVSTSTSTSPLSQLLTKTFDAATSFSAGEDVASFYVIPTNTSQDVKIRNFLLLERTLSDISLAADSHVILRGDLTDDSEDWETTNAYIESQFRSYFFNEDGSQIAKMLYGSTEGITALFKVIIRDKNYSFQDGLRYFYGVQGSLENYLYINTAPGNLIIIGFADNTNSYSWEVFTDSSYSYYPPLPSPE